VFDNIAGREIKCMERDAFDSQLRHVVAIAVRPHQHVCLGSTSTSDHC
jgi:hypothetical protein